MAIHARKRKPPRDGRDVLIEMGRKMKRKRAPARTPATGPMLPRVRSWARAIVRSLFVGGLLGGLIVMAVMYRHAVVIVETRLAGAVWTVPGHVWSGPIELWPGLALSPTELAADLQSAGYARVPKAVQPGDFQVSDDAVHVVGRAASGPGWSVSNGDTLITFAEGRVRSITPDRRVSFAPATLAVVRGPDNENRSPVPLERIPRTMQQAVLAMEDARFYDHPGIDAVGILRALVADLRAGDWAQGGSTLTQQVAKNIFLSGERTANRKLSEALLAVALERSLSKDEILQLYLNEIYMGQVGGSAICGMDAAARAYFGKPIERVSLAEAATLAGIISSPNPYSPIRHPDAALERRNLALDRMEQVGFADAAAVAKAKGTRLEVHASAGGRSAPWAVDAAVETVEDALGEGIIARDALEVYTTISPPLQRLAERSVQEGLTDLVAAHPKLADVQAALVVVRARDGAVVALVGSRDYAASPYDRAFQARRQVGSTIKPLTMLAAFETTPALSPATVFIDEPISRESDGKAWTPSNYDKVFVGPVALRQAIAASRNIPAVLLAESVGMGRLRDRWRALGLTSATAYPSAALGGFGATPVELAGAYAIFAGGAYHAPWLTRGATKGGATVLDSPPDKAEIRYSERAVFLATDVLRSVMKEGTGKSAAKYGVGPGAAGKSGTTDGYVDAWFVGTTGPYAVAVWVGFDKNQPIGLTGSQAALPTWARFVAGTGTSGAVAGPPSSVVSAEICRETGLPPCASCVETRAEYFTAGQVPEPSCGVLEETGAAVKNGWEKIGDFFGLRGE